MSLAVKGMPAKNKSPVKPMSEKPSGESECKVHRAAMAGVCRWSVRGIINPAGRLIVPLDGGSILRWCTVGRVLALAAIWH